MSKIVRHAFAALLVLAPPAAAQSGPAPAHHPLVTRRDALVSLALIAGAAALDRTVRDEAQAGRNPTRNDIASVGNAFGNPVYVAPVLAAGWAAGKLAHSEAVSQAAYRAVLSGALAGTISAAIKIAVGRARPFQGGDPSQFRAFSRLDASFPSGHTTFAMAIASSLAHSIKPHWPAVLLYGATAVTGFARINDDKHWLSDVAAGAVIGYLVGRDVTDRLRRVRPIVGPGTAGLTVRF